jgi:predicted nucleic acid-binding protein
LVAYFDRREVHHDWAVAQMDAFEPPLLVNEPVLTEAHYLLRRHPEATDALIALVERDVLRVAFHLGDHIAEVRGLVRKYRDVPMSLADACIVRMAELNEGHVILTLDSDFSVYRKAGRDPLPLAMPGTKG